jgi:hypothetical protein
MALKKKTWMYILVAVCLIVLLALMHFLKPKNKIDMGEEEEKEPYTNFQESQRYSHTVDLPINTRFSCANMCAPPSRCSITGEPCTSDVDCTGCLPLQRRHGKKKYKKMAEGFENQIPLSTSSSSSNQNEEPVNPYFQGINTWRTTFDLGNAHYQKKYNAGLESKPFLLHYPQQTSLSGEFIDEGAMAYNSF